MDRGDRSTKTAADSEQGPSQSQSESSSDAQVWLSPTATLDGADSTTPQLLSKFELLSSQWSAPSSATSDRSETAQLDGQIEHAQRQRWSESPLNEERRQSSGSVQSQDSSLGRTTLSSHDTYMQKGEKVSVFERLHKNERRYRRRSRTHADDLSSAPSWQSYASAGLEKRLSYIAPGEVRRKKIKQRREVSSVSTPTSVKTDTVFDRLYTGTPRKRSSLLPITPTRKKDSISSRSGSWRSGKLTLSSKNRLSRTPSNSKTPLIRNDGRSVQSSPAVARRPPNQSGSSSAAKQKRRPVSTKSVRSSSGSSVFDRLYAASKKAPPPAQKEKVTPKPKIMSSAKKKSSVTPNEKRDSFFDRLHRNEPRPTPVRKPKSTPRQKQKPPPHKSLAKKPPPSLRQTQPASLLGPIPRSIASSGGSSYSHTSPTSATTGTPSPNDSQQRDQATAQGNEDDEHASTPALCLPDDSNFARKDASTPSEAEMQPEFRDWEDSNNALRVTVDAQTDLIESIALTPAEKAVAEAVAESERICSAICIQSFWRACFAKHTANRLRRAVLWLQATHRMHKQRDLYKSQLAERRLFAALNRADATNHARNEWKETSARHELQLLREKSARMLQSSLRGISERERFTGLNRSSKKIQAVWRGWNTRKGLKLSRWAATLMQSVFRGYKCRKQLAQEQTLKRFQERRASTGPLVPSVSPRYTLALTSSAVTILQAVARGFLCRRTVHGQRPPASAVKRLRQEANKRKRLAKLRAYDAILLEKRKMALVVQTFWRMFSASRMYQELRTACITIQSVARGHRSRKQAKSLRTCMKIRESGAVKLQSQWRGVKARINFFHLLHWIILSQSVCRGFLDRRRLLWRRISFASTAIQSQWRRVQAQKHFFRDVASAITLQAFARGLIVRQNQKRERRRCAAATKIQSSYRRYTADKYVLLLRDFVVRKNHACVLFQGMWRTFCARNMFQRQISATVKIQSAYRGSMARSRVKAICFVASVIQLQSWWRSLLTQRRYFLTTSAISLIQSGLRGHRDRRRCANIKRLAASATTIQAFWRRLCARRFRHQLLFSIVKLQSTVRCYRKRDDFKVLLAKHKAATKIQSLARCYSDKMAFDKFRVAAVVGQTVIRGFLTRRQFQCIRRTASAVIIQCSWRRNLAKQNLHRELAAIVLLQSNLRGSLRRRAFAYSIARARAATKIQAWMLCNRSKLLFRQKRLSTIMVQATIRGRLDRKHFQSKLRYSAATKIQRQWRRHFLSDRYQSCLQMITAFQGVVRGSQCRHAIQRQMQKEAATIKIQTIVRGYQSRRKLRRSVASAAMIQSVVRCTLVRIRFVAMLRNRAASVIQNYWRQYHVAKARHLALLATVRLQAIVRGFFCRREFKNLRRQQAALKIQSMTRCIHRRSLFLLSRHSATIVQAVYRGSMAREKYRQQQLIASSTTIQGFWRSFLAQRARRHSLQAAVKLQCACRIFLARKSFTTVEQRRAAIAIQAFWRQCLAQRDRRHALRAIVKLQCACRGVLSRTMLKVHLGMHVAAVKIQSSWRRHLARRSRFRALQAIVAVQAVIRGLLARKTHVVRLQDLLNKQLLATSMIQSQWRRYQDETSFKKRKVAARVLQDFYRERRDRRMQRILQSCLTIQCHVRRFLAQRSLRVSIATSKKVQATTRGFISRRKFLHLKQDRASLTLQRAWTRYNYSRNLQSFKPASIVAQSAVRGYFARSKILEARRQQARHAASTKIQAIFRGFKARQDFQQVSAATVCIQAYARRFTCRKMLYTHQAAARTIHRSYCFSPLRRRVEASRAERAIFETRQASAMKIQAQWKRIAIRRQCDLMKKAACTIEQCYIQWKCSYALRRLGVSMTMLERVILGKLSRSSSLYALLQINMVECFSVLKRVGDLAPALLPCWKEAILHTNDLVAVLIQSAFRGHLVRCKLPSRVSFKLAGKANQRERPAVVQYDYPINREVYRTLLAIRTRAAIAKRAEAQAEQRIEFLLGLQGRHKIRCAELSLETSPCLIRAAEKLVHYRNQTDALR